MNPNVLNNIYFKNYNPEFEKLYKILLKMEKLKKTQKVYNNFMKRLTDLKQQMYNDDDPDSMN